MYTKEAVVQEIKKAFPSIAAEMEDDIWRGLFHLEISCFARYTQVQIDTQNKHELIKCLSVADKFYIQGDEQVQNAVCVSFIEHLNFQDGKVKRAWAKEVLPKQLSIVYQSMADAGLQTS